MSLLSQGSWEKKIIERVHNVNATLKRPLSDDGDGTPKPKRGRPRQQSMVLTRYPPLRDTADDFVTTSRNIAALQKELERDSPREDILIDCGEVNATVLLSQYKELHKSYVVRPIHACMHERL